MGLTEWLICIIAAIGFAFDTYEILMFPLIGGKALGQLLGEPPGSPLIRSWISYIFWTSTLAGGVFGLLGGYLTDRFGRRRVLTWSILLYACSAFAAAFSTSPAMLLVLRCTTFMGVCIEFVAAAAWLAELFPNPKQRELVLGTTQVFASFGGMLVTLANSLAVSYEASLPFIQGMPSSWRYTLMSGVIPAIPLIVIRPFLPESPAWQAKRTAGTLRRPSFGELFTPALRRTTITSTLVCASAYAAAYGAIQLTPNQIVPALPQVAPVAKQAREAQQALAEVHRRWQALDKSDPQFAAVDKERKAKLGAWRTLQEQADQEPNKVQFFQEVGGLTGRVLLAAAAMVIVSRRTLLALFQLPGLLLIPWVYMVPGTSDLGGLKTGMFFVGLLTVAQFSFFGNYLPRVYPLHLRGTGEGFAVNFGGRVLASFAFLLTPWLAKHWFDGKVAYAAAAVAGGVYVIGFVARFFLTEPRAEALPE